MVPALAQSPHARIAPTEILWAKAKDAAAARVEPAGKATPASFSVLSSHVLREATEACLCGGVMVTNKVLEVLMGLVLSK